VSDQITMYTTSWCGYCKRLERQMRAEGIAYRTVDVEQETAYGDRIVARTGGYRTVPTLEIEGELLVNPSIEEVRLALRR
jgi:mycoredoxin